jgi:hypothetical protein
LTIPHRKALPYYLGRAFCNGKSPKNMGEQPVYNQPPKGLSIKVLTSFVSPDRNQNLTGED